MTIAATIAALAALALTVKRVRKSLRNRRARRVYMETLPYRTWSATQDTGHAPPHQ